MCIRDRAGAGAQSGSTGNTSSEAEKEITYINGVLTDSDEDSVTIEYGSNGDFNQTTFDISNADIQIGGNKKQGGPLAANLNLEIGYYVENGDYIAVSVYGDGSESMTPSWVYDYEMKSVSGNVRYNDDSTMTIETGSDGDFYEMTFDISSACLLYTSCRMRDRHGRLPLCAGKRFESGASPSVYYRDGNKSGSG